MKFDLSKFRQPGVRFNIVSVLKEITNKGDHKLLAKIDYFKAKGMKADQSLYHAVFKKARTTCLAPDCEQVTTYRKNGDFWGYNKYCNVQCCHKDPSHNERIGKSYRANPANDDIADRIKQVWLKKYGTENPLHDVPEIWARRSKTMVARYGHEQPFATKHVKRLQKEAWQRNYGTDNPSKSPIIKQRIQDSVRATLGVLFPLQSPEVFARANYNSHRIHTLRVGGKDFNYQGYEGHVISVLINQLKISSKAINTNPSLMPEIWYTHKQRKRRYFPDIRVKYKNKDICIEVKSDYTAGVYSKDIFYVVKRKAKAAFMSGVDLRIWVVFPKNKKIVRVSNMHNLSFKEFKALAKSTKT